MACEGHLSEEAALDKSLNIKYRVSPAKAQRRALSGRESSKHRAPKARPAWHDQGKAKPVCGAKRE